MYVGMYETPFRSSPRVHCKASFGVLSLEAPLGCYAKFHEGVLRKVGLGRLQSFN